MFVFGSRIKNKRFSFSKPICYKINIKNIHDLMYNQNDRVEHCQVD